MGQKIRLPLFIKGRKLIHLSWIYYFYIRMSTLNESLNESYNDCRKLYKKNFRLLSKYKKNNDSSIVCLNEVIRNGVYDKNDICNNENMNTEKRKQTNSSSSKIEGYNKSYMKKKSCFFETKKYSRLEKKIFKELNYIDYLKNNRTISDKVYKKIVRKIFALRILLPLLLFVLLLISILLDGSLGRGLVKGLFEVVNICAEGKWKESFQSILKDSSFSWLFNVPEGVTKYAYVTRFFAFLIYCTSFFILGITVILGILYYHKKVKKYEKIKFRKR
ncbi:hypothetical protein MKS88_002184 [Plasmodium brasilianum]|uniref:Uncharacterized protein n=1 Tax=Plasmodium brasilianum TaxID=5824 RepID=A0ACB9YED8_PLABR|nr:hypothetical protein MKS88_002184 [Plasmodium brasilianum]